MNSKQEHHIIQQITKYCKSLRPLSPAFATSFQTRFPTDRFSTKDWEHTLKSAAGILEIRKMLTDYLPNSTVGTKSYTHFPTHTFLLLPAPNSFPLTQNHSIPKRHCLKISAWPPSLPVNSELKFSIRRSLHFRILHS